MFRSHMEILRDAVLSVILVSHTLFSPFLDSFGVRDSGPSQHNDPEILNVPEVCLSKIVLISVKVEVDTG